MGNVTSIILILIILLPILYLLYLKFFSPPSPTTSTTTLKDSKGYVIKKVDPKHIKGKVKISESNRIWSATADKKIEKGTEVKIKDVEGVHLIVEDIDKEKEEIGEIEEGDEGESDDLPDEEKIKKLEEEIFEVVD